MPHNVCPWWLGYVLANPLRRLYQNPKNILAPYLHSGMTVVEIGPGMGFFTMDIARVVGDEGRVIAIDVQPRMLSGLRRRARRAALLHRIETRLAPPGGTGMEDLEQSADFVLAFAVVHELPDMARLFDAAARSLKPGGWLLLAEPNGHVDRAAFSRTIAAAETSGLRVSANPSIRGSCTALLEKPRDG
jgi:SAM-dependent methyltransferase